MSEMKKKRNAEVKDMEDEVHIILSSKTGTSIEDICDKVDLLHKTKLRFARHTGEPENIKEVEDLVSSWDFKYIVRRETGLYGSTFRTVCSPSYDFDSDTFKIFKYIKIGDYVKEAYESMGTTDKILLIDVIGYR
jgi:hypothetical protein